MKKQNGITLIALIITIIVLLILAVVAIGAVQDSDIIVHAEDAAEKYKTKGNEENQTLKDYADFITDKTTETVDHDAIGAILTGLYSEDIEESIVLQRLKDEGAIEQDTVDIWSGMVETPFMDGTMGYYLYKTNALYKMQETEDENTTFSYVEGNDYQLQYNMGKCAKITKETLEDIFLNKSKTELEQIFDLPKSEFIDYIVNNSKRRIKSIDDISVSLSGITLKNLELRDENGNDIILEIVMGEEIRTGPFGEALGYTVRIGGTDHVEIEVSYGT